MPAATLSRIVRSALLILSRRSATGRELRVEFAGEGTGEQTISSCAMPMPSTEESIDDYMDRARNVVSKWHDQVRFAEKTYLITSPEDGALETVNHMFCSIVLRGIRLKDSIRLELAYA